MTHTPSDHEHSEDATAGTEATTTAVRDQRLRLVVKGDDMGAGHGVNIATIDAHRRGILTTTNVIVPGAWFPEAVRLVNENPTLDVGIHLALTSEWTNVKWRPLTSVPGLVDPDGYLPPAVHPREEYPAGASLEESDWTLEQIEQELRAQLELGLRHLPQATYTWCHMLFPTIDPSVASLVARLSAEYGLIEPKDLGIQSVRAVYDGGDSGEVKAAKLAERLEGLEPGLWLHIDHAATDDPEIRAFGHPGYENVAADRSANVYAWTSPSVREVVDRRGIELTNYRQIRTRPVTSGNDCDPKTVVRSTGESAPRMAGRGPSCTTSR